LSGRYGPSGVREAVGEGDNVDGGDGEAVHVGDASAVGLGVGTGVRMIVGVGASSWTTSVTVSYSARTSAGCRVKVPLVQPSELSSTMTGVPFRVKLRVYSSGVGGIARAVLSSTGSLWNCSAVGICSSKQ
jgi:hypothetical protein